MSEPTQPKLKLVSEDGIKFELYIDGKYVKGIHSLNIHCAVDEIMTHTIEYVTAVSGDGKCGKGSVL